MIERQEHPTRDLIRYLFNPNNLRSPLLERAPERKEPKLKVSLLCLKINDHTHTFKQLINPKKKKADVKNFQTGKTYSKLDWISESVSLIGQSLDYYTWKPSDPDYDWMLKESFERLITSCYNLLFESGLTIDDFSRESPAQHSEFTDLSHYIQYLFNYISSEEWPKDLTDFIWISSIDRVLRVGDFDQIGEIIKNSDTPADIIDTLLAHVADPRILDYNGRPLWRHIINWEGMFSHALRLRSAQAEFEVCERLQSDKTEEQKSTGIPSAFPLSLEEKRSFPSAEIKSKKIIFSPAEVKSELGISSQLMPLWSNASDAVHFPLLNVIRVLSGSSPYKNIVEGWRAFLKEALRCSSANNTFLFINHKRVSPAKLLAINNQIDQAEKQILLIIEDMWHEIYGYIKSSGKESGEQEDQLITEFSRLKQKIPMLLSSFFNSTIIPQLQSVFTSLTVDQIKSLCWIPVELISSCAFLMADLQHKMGKNTAQQPYRIKKLLTRMDIIFAPDGSVEITIWVQGMRFTKEEKVIASQQPLLIKFRVSPIEGRPEEPMISLESMIDSLSLARLFFEVSCADRAKKHRTQLSSHSVPEAKETIPEKMALANPLALLQNSKPDSRASHKILLNFYQGFIKTPLSDRQLKDILELFGQFNPQPDSMDNFLLAAARYLPAATAMVQALLTHIPEEACAEHALNLTPYTAEQREKIFYAFSIFLREQQRAPMLGVHWEEDLLVLDNIRLVQLKKLLALHENVYVLLNSLNYTLIKERIFNYLLELEFPPGQITVAMLIYSLTSIGQFTETKPRDSKGEFDPTTSGTHQSLLRALFQIFRIDEDTDLPTDPVLLFEAVEQNSNYLLSFLTQGSYDLLIEDSSSLFQEWAIQAIPLWARLLTYITTPEIYSDFTWALRAWEKLTLDALEILNSLLSIDPTLRLIKEELTHDMRFIFNQVRTLGDEELLYEERPQAAESIGKAIASCWIRGALLIDNDILLRDFLEFAAIRSGALADAISDGALDFSSIQVTWDLAELHVPLTDLGPRWPLERPKVVRLLREHKYGQRYKKILDIPVAKPHEDLLHSPPGHTARDANLRILENDGQPLWLNIMEKGDFTRALQLRTHQAMLDMTKQIELIQAQQKPKQDAKLAPVRRPDEKKNLPYSSSRFFSNPSREASAQLGFDMAVNNVLLPICMMWRPTPEQLSGVSLYSDPMHGWLQLCRDLIGSQVNPSQLLLLNGQPLPREILLGLKKDLDDVETQVYSTIINVMGDEISRHIKPTEKEKRAELANVKKQLNKHLESLLAIYFKEVIFPQLTDLLKLSPKEMETLCWNWDQNCLSGPTMVISECLFYQNEKYNRLKIKRKVKVNDKIEETAHPFDFHSPTATKTTANIQFSKHGVMQVVTCCQDMFASGSIPGSGKMDIGLLNPKTQVVVTSTGTVIAGKPALPYSRVMTNNLALARLFFEEFCAHQVETHQGKNILGRIYQGLLETPPADEDLRIMLDLFSHFKPNPSCVDDFFIATLHDLPSAINIANVLLNPTIGKRKGYFAKHAIDLDGYTLKQRENIMKAFNVIFCVEQRNAPRFGGHLEGTSLVLDNTILPELRKLILAQENICALVNNFVAEKSKAVSAARP